MIAILWHRLRTWGGSKGWGSELSICPEVGENWGKVMARVGPTTGYGWTTNEAINNCADGLIDEGWQDDRP